MPAAANVAATCASVFVSVVSLFVAWTLSAAPAATNRPSEGPAACMSPYSAVISSHCINYTATRYRQQGDDLRRRVANVIRGSDGDGPATRVARDVAFKASRYGSVGIVVGPDLVVLARLMLPASEEAATLPIASHVTVQCVSNAQRVMSAEQSSIEVAHLLRLYDQINSPANSVRLFSKTALQGRKTNPPFH